MIMAERAIPDHDVGRAMTVALTPALPRFAPHPTAARRDVNVKRESSASKNC
jgi:hypothetical protein